MYICILSSTIATLHVVYLKHTKLMYHFVYTPCTVQPTTDKPTTIKPTTTVSTTLSATTPTTRMTTSTTMDNGNDLD